MGNLGFMCISKMFLSLLLTGKVWDHFTTSVQFVNCFIQAKKNYLNARHWNILNKYKHIQQQVIHKKLKPQNDLFA